MKRQKKCRHRDNLKVRQKVNEMLGDTENRHTETQRDKGTSRNRDRHREATRQRDRKKETLDCVFVF
jgi:hypothetical protein